MIHSKETNHRGGGGVVEDDDVVMGIRFDFKEIEAEGWTWLPHAAGVPIKVSYDDLFIVSIFISRPRPSV